MVTTMMPMIPFVMLVQHLLELPKVGLRFSTQPRVRGQVRRCVGERSLTVGRIPHTDVPVVIENNEGIQTGDKPIHSYVEFALVPRHLIAYVPLDDALLKSLVFVFVFTLTLFVFFLHRINCSHGFFRKSEEFRAIGSHDRDSFSLIDIGKFVNPRMVFAIVFQNLTKGLDFPLRVGQHVRFRHVNARGLSSGLLVLFVVIDKVALLVPFFQPRNVIESLPGPEICSPVRLVGVGIDNVGIVGVVDSNPIS
mmetsp:Transcript_6477/g.13757  ORF Transcript_6477/g.13757 Transcript_6477/m.13757 type:complete len:251 (-) Transcript_6477:534-1286(-)